MSTSYFFCGVGGSGMSALALICQKNGVYVSGSDRAYDQGRSKDKFKSLAAQGVHIHPQDGFGITKDLTALVVSSAVEDSIPDVAAAKALNIPIIKRAALLASLFNDAKIGISIAGTSGKSTVTGMVAHVLEQLNLDPTVMNGAHIKTMGSNMRVGSGPFVTETDESDGSIALYKPAVAVVNNIALDHKSIEELEQLFGEFIGRATKAIVLNFDDSRLKSLATKANVPVFGYTLKDAKNLQMQVDGSIFEVWGETIHLKLPGAHNISNALACLNVCKALDIEIPKALRALETFTGIKRRMDIVGTKSGITVIDDFGHNPDKIAATLTTLKAFDGRLIIMFQPHGFGPLKLMGKHIAETFADHLGKDDILLMPEAYYAGGTADRSVTAKHVIGWAKEQGVNAQWFEKRTAILPKILDNAQNNDRIVIMGARDDTLSDFAAKILESL